MGLLRRVTRYSVKRSASKTSIRRGLLCENPIGLACWATSHHVPLGLPLKPPIIGSPPRPSITPSPMTPASASSDVADAPLTLISDMQPLLVLLASVPHVPGPRASYSRGSCAANSVAPASIHSVTPARRNSGPDTNATLLASLALTRRRTEPRSPAARLAPQASIAAWIAAVSSAAGS